MLQAVCLHPSLAGSLSFLPGSLPCFLVNDRVMQAVSKQIIIRLDPLILIPASFYLLRHTFAVRAIEIPEFDIKSLSEILGHKNVSFTLNVYGRANLQQKTRCMNLLNDLL